MALLEGRDPFLASLYLGLPALGLVAAAFAGERGRRPRALLAIGLVAVLVALGRYAPVYDVATALVPPLRVLRYPVKAMPIAAFAWAGLVVHGVEAWRAGRLQGARRALAFVPVALVSLTACGIAAAVLTDAAWLRPITASLLAAGSRPATEGLARGLAIHGLLGAVVAAFITLRPRASSIAVWAASAAAVLDLGIAHPRPNPVAPAALYAHRPEVLATLGDASRVRLYSYDYGEGARARRWLGDPAALNLARQPAGWSPGATEPLAMQLALAPQAAGRWGLRQAFDVDYRGLQPAPLARLTSAVRAVEERPDLVLKLLHVGAVTHVTALHAVAGGQLRRIAEVPGLYARPLQVFEVPGALGRARVVSGVRIADGIDGLGALLDPGFDPALSIVLPEGEAREPSTAFAGRAEIVADGTDRLRVEAELAGDGYLVVSDTYDPGWTARVDGRSAVLLRANTCFRAVALPAGRHVVEMVYRPRVVLAALIVSALAAAAIVAGLAGLRAVPGPTSGEDAVSRR
jgi:hypothetical protein